VFDVHPVANKFPLMVGNEYQELVADIQERGQLHPVVLHNDQLLDGRNRLKACEELGITPTLIAWDAPDGVTAAEWIVSTNLQRRHLTSQQRAMLAADPDILDVLEAEALERQTRGVTEKIPEGSESRAEAAKTFQTNERYVSDAKKIRKRKPELVEPVINGTLSLKEAKQKVESAELDEALTRIDEDDRGVLSELVHEAMTTHSQKLEMATHLAAMSQAERSRVKVLAQSDDPHEREVAGTIAADLPPPLSPEVKSVLALRSEATMCRRRLSQLNPNHRWLEGIDDIIERLSILMEG